jgi:hypothetical protein
MPTMSSDRAGWVNITRPLAPFESSMILPLIT